VVFDKFKETLEDLVLETTQIFKIDDKAMLSFVKRYPKAARLKFGKPVPQLMTFTGLLDVLQARSSLREVYIGINLENLPSMCEIASFGLRHTNMEVLSIEPEGNITSKLPHQDACRLLVGDLLLLMPNLVGTLYAWRTKRNDRFYSAFVDVNQGIQHQREYNAALEKLTKISLG
jgi:hypothetical protein